MAYAMGKGRGPVLGLVCGNIVAVVCINDSFGISCGWSHLAYLQTEEHMAVWSAIS